MNNYKPDFNKLFITYQPFLVKMAATLIIDKMAAEDIVSDVFIKFWEHPNSFPSEYMAKGYLYTCTRNSCYNYLQHRSCRKRILESYAPTQTSHYNMFNDFIRKEVRDELGELITRLTPMARQVVEMSYIGGASYAKMAKQLNRSRNTIRNNLVRGLKNLRENFQFDEAA